MDEIDKKQIEEQEKQDLFAQIVKQYLLTGSIPEPEEE